MTVNDLIDALYCYDGNIEITILDKKDNMTFWRSLEPKDFETIPVGSTRVMRLHPNIAPQINPGEVEFGIG